MERSKKTVYLECDCSTKDHLIAVSYIKWDKDDIDLCLHMQINHELGFFKRLWAAIKYVVGIHPCRFGTWGETLLDKEKARQLLHITQEYLLEVDDEHLYP